MSQDLIKRSDGLLTPFPAGLDRITQLRYGFRFPWLGLRYLLRERDLLPWIVVPVLINIVFILLAFLGATWGSPWLVAQLWAAPIGGFALTIWHALVMIVGLLLFVVGVVVMYAVSGILGTPFYDYLSARVELRIAAESEEIVDWPQFWRDVAQSIRHSIMGFGLWILVMMPLFCVGLVPGVGPLIELSVGLVFTALFLAREMMDGAMSRRRFPFRRKLRIVRAHIMVMLGFGLACAAILWVPLLNFVFMPVSMVGGTLLFLMIESSGEVVD